MTWPGRTLSLGALLAGLALLSFACGRMKTAFPRAPVVIISVDTLRADHLGCYGHRRVATPSVDALARDSVRYENAYSHVPLTVPSHAALLTGRLPYENGVRDNIGFRLSSGEPTLAAVLRVNGYATGAAVSSYLLRADRGLNAGFDFYDDRLGENSPDERPGDRTAERLEEWMKTVLDRPVFALLHLYEPHTPYEPPEPFKSQYQSSPYDGEIAAADAIVGRFLGYLKRKGLYDRAILFFLSDHGEGLNDHGEDEHGVFLYREAIRVPLLVKLPGSRGAGQVVSRPVGLVDVFPTVLKLLGLPAREAESGLSLPLSGREDPAPARRIYSETLYPRLHMHWSDLASLTDARYQYIEAPRPELYDILADPAERRDLAGDKPPAFRSMRLELQRTQRPLKAPQAATPEEIAKLASLGYIGAMSGTLSDRNLPDPKDHVAELPQYKRLFTLFYAKKDAEAAAAARDLLAVNPRFLSAWRMLSESLVRLGQPGEAAGVLEKGIAEVGETGVGEEISQAYEQLAELCEKSGDRARLEKVLREAVARNLATEPLRRGLARLLTETSRANEAVALLAPLKDGGDADTLDGLGVALAEAGRLEEARSAFEKALALRPANASVLLHLGSLALRRKDPAGAREWFEKALRAEPDAPGTLTLLGVARAALGDEAGARQAWQRAIALDTRQYDALFNLAILEGRSGRTEEARRVLQRFVAMAPTQRYAANLAEARRLLRSLPKR